MNFDSIQAKLTWKTWLLFMVLSQSMLISMSIWTFPFISSRAQGREAFDMRPMGYSVDDARAFLGAIDKKGISFYKEIQLPLDIVYPLLICLFILCTLVILARALNGGRLSGEFKAPRWLSWLMTIPLLGMLSDYFENICVFMMLSNPLRVSDIIIHAANFFTLAKSISTTINWSSVIALAIMALVANIKTRGKAWKPNSP
jgi:hypothetical protein